CSLLGFVQARSVRCISQSCHAHPRNPVRTCLYGWPCATAHLPLASLCALRPAVRRRLFWVSHHLSCRPCAMCPSPRTPGASQPILSPPILTSPPNSCLRSTRT